MKPITGVLVINIVHLALTGCLDCLFVVWSSLLGQNKKQMRSHGTDDAIISIVLLSHSATLGGLKYHEHCWNCAPMLSVSHDRTSPLWNPVLQEQSFAFKYPTSEGLPGGLCVFGGFTRKIYTKCVRMCRTGDKNTQQEVLSGAAAH